MHRRQTIGEVQRTGSSGQRQCLTEALPPTGGVILTTGLEPAISALGGQRRIHWATRALSLPNDNPKLTPTVPHQMHTINHSPTAHHTCLPHSHYTRTHTYKPQTTNPINHTATQPHISHQPFYTPVNKHTAPFTHLCTTREKTSTHRRTESDRDR